MPDVYTVKQLADLAGVTIRTLHHYDQIGLLKPSSVGGNGYRYYQEEALYRLQQILFYRELGMRLGDIKRIVEDRDFDVLVALESHRAALQARSRKIQRLIRTIDETTKHLKGTRSMSPKRLFHAFSDAEQEKLSQEAAKRWNAETIRASNANWEVRSSLEKLRILEEGNALYAELVAVMSHGPASPDAQAIVARWHTHLQHFWSPSDEQLLGLAELYNEDPRFRSNYENMAPGLAAFIRQAVKVYVQSRE